MQLDKYTAKKIVKRAMKIIHHSVNVMDHDGVIIASGNSTRLNQRHTGAVLALRENRVVEIDQALAQKWNFEAQPGINLPIHYLGKNIGVVGISGEPTQVKQYAELVKMTAELIVAFTELSSWALRRIRAMVSPPAFSSSLSPSIIVPSTFTTAILFGTL